MYSLIPIGSRGGFWLLTGCATVMAMLEALGVASIMPLVALLSNPEVVWNSVQNSTIGKLLPIGVEKWPVHWVGTIVILLFVATNLFGLVTLSMTLKFSASLGIRLSRDLADKYLGQGYLFLRVLGAAPAANDVTREVEKLVAGGLLQICLLASKVAQVALIVIMLAIVSPLFTLFFCGISSLLYASLYVVLRKRAGQAGQETMDASIGAARAANELFNGAKEILVAKKRTFFVDRLSEFCTRFYRADAFARLAPTVPKYIIELAAFTLLLSLPVYRSFQGEEYQSLLPIIALFAYAGYRILPALQQTYASFTVLKHYEPLSVRISSLMTDINESRIRSLPNMKINTALEFIDVTYRYGDARTPALNSFSLKINIGEKLAIVGPSGSGKSTFLDILLGLSPINSGVLKLDGTFIDRNLSWESVGYVPQAPMLFNGTVAENIAFGISKADIDIKSCRMAAKMAGFEQVINALPNRYDTVLGENLNLSGGELQRLAIARALYKDPPLLIMDEPSSALDPVIRDQVMSRLCAKERGSTLVVVTHDWDLLHYFDRLVIVDGGCVVADGTFKLLRERLLLLRDSWFVSNANA